MGLDRKMSPTSQSVHIVPGGANVSASNDHSTPLLRETFDYENTSMQMRTQDGGSQYGNSMLDQNVRMTIDQTNHDGNEVL